MTPIRCIRACPCRPPPLGDCPVSSPVAELQNCATGEVRCTLRLAELPDSQAGKEGDMPLPLYQAKAEFFRMLGHPVRIRVLELLASGPMPVRELLAQIEVERSNLSQQLAVLRRSGIVTATRHGTTVVYALTGGDVAELMRAARRILTEMLAGQNQLLAELRESLTEPV